MTECLPTYSGRSLPPFLFSQFLPCLQSVMVSGFEPIAGSLAGIALIFPLYDACDRLHAGFMVLRSFGRDVQLLWKQLDAQWVRLKLIMQRDKLSVQNPPDSDDPHHWVTNTIKEQLGIVETHFRDCESLVHKQFSG